MNMDKPINWNGKMLPRLRSRLGFIGKLKYLVGKLTGGEVYFSFKKDGINAFLDFTEGLHLATFVETFLAEQYQLPLGFDISKKTRVLDLGANIGLASLYFASRIPGAEVDAFEPNEVNFRQLIKNILSNNFVINPYFMAAGQKNGWVWFKEDAVFSSVQNDQVRDQAAKRVKIMDIFEFIQEKNYRIIKIDIEGAEHEILNDSRMECVKAELIFVEYHSICEGNSCEGVKKKLENFGYKVEKIHEVSEKFGVLRAQKRMNI